MAAPTVGAVVWQRTVRHINGTYLDILRLVAEGRSTLYICQRVGYCKETVNRRIRKMIDLLWAVDRTSLVVRALQDGYLSLDQIDVKR